MLSQPEYNAIKHITNSLHISCRLMDSGVERKEAMRLAGDLSDWMHDEIAQSQASSMAVKWRNWLPCKSCSDNPLYGGAGRDCAGCQL